MERPDLKMKLIETKNDVPNNNYAKLMYYLYCVYTVVKNKAIFKGCEGYTDYKNYNLLSKKDKETVMGLAILFNPNVMKSKSLFNVNPNILSEGISNQIFEATGLNLTPEEPRIEGRFMYCTESWFNFYFYDPIGELTYDIYKKQNECCECLFENSCCNCFESCFNCICNRNNICEGKCSKKCKKIWGMIMILCVLGLIIASIIYSYKCS